MGRSFEIIIQCLVICVSWQEVSAYRPGHLQHSFAQNESKLPSSTRGLRQAARQTSDMPLGYIILSMKEANDKNTMDDSGYPGASSENPFEDGSSTARILEVNLGSADSALDSTEDGSEIRKNDVKPTGLMGGFLKREIWTIPLLAVAGLNIFLIGLFEVYVLCRAKGRGPLFLGQMLLFGLFLCSSLSLVFVIQPTVLSCYLARLGISFSYTLVLSVLMVKCVFLLSLDSGVTLAVPYQACLLLFSLLVQVAINIQWVLVSPPAVNVMVSPWNGSMSSQCSTTFSQMLLTTASYNVFLILFVGILALKTRGIRDNYRESTYIGFSILVTLPIWISWTIAGWILQGKHQDACVAFGLLAQALATFLIMFMPKGRQLAAMGKEGMFLEDQDDQCSGYSPSFFHFKPVKSYKATLIGDGNVYTTLEPTISTLNPNVFFHRSDFHPGMIY